MFDRSYAEGDALRNGYAVRFEKSAAGIAEIVEEAGLKSEVSDLVGENYVVLSIHPSERCRGSDVRGRWLSGSSFV